MKTLKKDLSASIAVALVALPLCLGIALASGAPLISGLIAGIIGGIVVGSLSGSHVSVAGPAAGLVAIVLAALDQLGSLELFMVALMLAGVMQMGLGFASAGRIAHYVPSAVIRGLLAAIGIILILKQIPHAMGYDVDAEGDFSFSQLDGENTFTELLKVFEHFELGAMFVAAACFALIYVWNRSKRLQSIPIPVQLAIVVVGIVANELFSALGSDLWLTESHRVNLPSYDGLGGFAASLPSPDFSGLTDSRVYVVALTLALVASLETLLNLEAADRLDPHQRISPPNRELLAQGVGNVASGAIGGLPITSVVVRSSVNAYSGAETRWSAILHGVWMLAAVLLVPGILGLIPLSALAVILIAIGYKLARPTLFVEMYRRGWSQFLPFVATVAAIVLTDLLIGVLIGLAIGIASVIRNLVSTPFLSKTPENPEVGHPARIKFGQQLTFLHRARLIDALEDVAAGSELILDASQTDYIDPDVMEIIRTFRDVRCLERDIRLSIIGLRGDSEHENHAQYVDVFTKARQSCLTPGEALALMQRGNQRFASGQPLERDLMRQVRLTSQTQHPLAAVLSCIDSRVPTELLFDKGFGDIFSVRIAGNVLSDEVIGSLEYAAEVSKVPLILILGHTGCGAIKAACQDVRLGHITGLLEHVQPAVAAVRKDNPSIDEESTDFTTLVSHANVSHVHAELCQRSHILRKRIDSGELAVVGALYHLEQGEVEFFGETLEAADAERADTANLSRPALSPA